MILRVSSNQNNLMILFYDLLAVRGLLSWDGQVGEHLSCLTPTACGAFVAGKWPLLCSAAVAGLLPPPPAVPRGGDGTFLPTLWHEQLPSGLLKTSFKTRGALEMRAGSGGPRCPMRLSPEPLQPQLLPHAAKLLLQLQHPTGISDGIPAAGPLPISADGDAGTEDTFFTDICIPSVIPSCEHQPGTRLLLLSATSLHVTLCSRPLPTVQSGSMLKQIQCPLHSGLSQRDTVSCARALLCQGWCVKS